MHKNFYLFILFSLFSFSVIGQELKDSQSRLDAGEDLKVLYRNESNFGLFVHSAGGLGIAYRRGYHVHGTRKRMLEVEAQNFKSSRSTEVITQCFTFIKRTDSATLSGSCKSTANGRPVATLQNPQERVQIFPRIINVAVPAPQHSPMFGQFPLSQMVCNLCLETISRTCAYSFPVGNLTLSQSGLR